MDDLLDRVLPGLPGGGVHGRVRLLASLLLRAQGNISRSSLKESFCNLYDTSIINFFALSVLIKCHPKRWHIKIIKK